jgi:hypothetical protein
MPKPLLQYFDGAGIQRGKSADDASLAGFDNEIGTGDQKHRRGKCRDAEAGFYSGNFFCHSVRRCFPLAGIRHVAMLTD